ncbi:D-alanyl-D-alanine carboxypeptidase family protein, partial [Acidobacteriota bacterium]
VFKYLEQIKEIEQPDNEPSSSLKWVCFECQGQKLYLPQALLVKSVSLPSNLSLLNVDKFNPMPLNYSPEDLVEIDQKWNFHASDYPKRLRSEAAEALEIMLQEAESKGIHLRVFSSFRSSEKQRTLYLNAIEKQGLQQEWVAKPGHSEHQLGTTVDLSNPNPSSVGHQSFGKSKEGIWLQENAEKFGFNQSYTQDNSRFTGYQSEPWHYRYLGIR